MSPPPRDPAPAAARLRVLVVDDDDVDRAAVRRGLARAGVEADVAEAPSGRDAVALLGAGAYDCVFLDYNLPGEDGLSLLRAFRAAGHRAPVVMLTGQGDEETAVELMKAGASDYLSKHAMSPERLASSLRYAVDLHRAHDDAARQRARFDEASERLRLATEAAAIGVWDHDPATGVTRWDARCREIFGLATEEPPTMASVMAHVHPDDRDMLERAVAEGLDPSGDGRLDLEYRIVRPDGATRWLDARGRASFAAAVPGAPADGGRRATRFTGTVIDVTDRKRAEEALRDEAQLVATIQRIGSSLTKELDLGRVVQTVTDEATHLTGAGFGAFLYDLVDPQGQRYTLSTLAGAARDAAATPVGPAGPHAPPRPSVAAAFPGGRIVRLDDVGALAGHAGGPPHLATPLRDLPVVSYLAVPVISHRGEVVGGLFFGHAEAGAFTERHERLVAGVAAWAAVAMDNARLYQAERESRAEAERANKAKSDFLATMSHELRTPLNAIGGYADLLDMGVRGPVSDAQREDLQRIMRAQRHLLSLINDVLNFAKLEAGHVRLATVDVPLRDLVADLQVLVAPQLQAKSIRYECRPCDPALYAHADPEKVRQVLLNLLSNAIKFTEAGGQVMVDAESAGHELVIRVRDTGVGIPADRLADVFAPFVQVDRGLTSTHEGTGLGLAISRDLARAMGGDLTATSEVGVGSTFRLTLRRGRGTAVGIAPGRERRAGLVS